MLLLGHEGSSHILEKKSDASIDPLHCKEVENSTQFLSFNAYPTHFGRLRDQDAAAEKKLFFIWEYARGGATPPL